MIGDRSPVRVVLKDLPRLIPDENFLSDVSSKTKDAASEFLVTMKTFEAADMLATPNM